VTEFTDEEKREVYRRAASNMGITDEQARRELAETHANLQAQAERLERLLREGDSSDNWTIEPLAEKSQVLVTAERGRPNEEGWLRTCVVLSLDMLGTWMTMHSRGRCTCESRCTEWGYDVVQPCRDGGKRQFLCSN